MKLDSNHSVQKTLQRSNATPIYSQTINQHLGLSVWTNENDRVSYQKTNHHTLSLYIEGGYSTRRVDLKDATTGAPDKLCIIPAGHQSEWQVGERQRFEHVYFSDVLLRRTALETFGLDPRHVELPDMTFFNDKILLQNCRSIFRESWAEPKNHLRLQEQTLSIMTDLLVRYGVQSVSKQDYRSGLGPSVLNRVIDYIHENIDKNVSLDALAAVADISPFHFVRMFKISTGETPHQKVMNIRIKVAAELLIAGSSQLEAAIACGFVDQSHFSKTFKRHYGITPRQFLQSAK